MKVFPILAVFYLGGLILHLYLLPPLVHLPISVLIVPHHDLVAGYRNQLFSIVQPKIVPQTVILVSPNHYQSGTANIQVAGLTWQTQAGELVPNQAMIQNLTGTGLATQSNGSFYNEHGIKNLLGPIKGSFPKSLIIPLILKQQTTFEQITALGIWLNQNCQACLLIASVDFSHYQTAPDADAQDDITIKALKELDQAKIMEKPLVDSPASLALAISFATSQQTPRFHLWKQSNSSKMAGDPQILGTSHVLAWFETIP